MFGNATQYLSDKNADRCIWWIWNIFKIPKAYFIQINFASVYNYSLYMYFDGVYKAAMYSGSDNINGQGITKRRD